jgi:hypothetical protein
MCLYSLCGIIFVFDDEKLYKSNCAGVISFSKIMHVSWKHKTRCLNLHKNYNIIVQKLYNISYKHYNT